MSYTIIKKIIPFLLILTLLTFPTTATTITPHVVTTLKNQIEITTQPHGCAVAGVQDEKGAWHIEGCDELEVTHLNLNDQTIEGFRHKTLPVFSVQYHPESSPGPHDSWYLFRRFIELIEQRMAVAVAKTG